MKGTQDWDTFTPPKSSSNNQLERGSVDFLYVKDGQKYQIRPVGKFVCFYKIFHEHNGSKRFAIIDDPDECSVFATHPEVNKPKTPRYAMYVLDRNDDNKLKVMEFPSSVWKAFKERYQLTGVKPGTSKGGDWVLYRYKENKFTKYSCQYIEPTPFTEEEKKVITAEFSGDKEKLAKIFKPDSDEEVEEKLFGDWEKKKDNDTSNDSPDTNADTSTDGASNDIDDTLDF